jgi:hypothetical protein
MWRRTLQRLELHTSTTEGSSIFAHPMRNLLSNVLHSPYKDSFKEFWATPVPWEHREYGAKPKPGDPIPLRDAATTLIIGKNNHINPELVESGEDNDYKVLMLYRETRGRYQKDSFTFPSTPVQLADLEEDWPKQLHRLGVVTEHADLPQRLAALRALIDTASLIVIPKEHGSIAEVQGPAGIRKWSGIIHTAPSLLHSLLDILELPMEAVLNNMAPFRNVQTPATELFRYDAKSYITTIDKLPCVKYAISIVGEKLVWVSPKEAMARFDTGIMEMPTPNMILLNELDKEFPTFDLIKNRDATSKTTTILPEMVHDPATRMATCLLPGDMHHTQTRAMMKAQGDMPIDVNHFSRFEFIKDEPWGVRAVFTARPVESDDDVTRLDVVAPLTIEDAEKATDGTENTPHAHMQDGEMARRSDPAKQVEQAMEIDMIERELHALDGGEERRAALAAKKQGEPVLEGAPKPSGGQIE